MQTSDQAAVGFFAKCDEMFENVEKKLLPVAKMRQPFLITVLYVQDSQNIHFALQRYFLDLELYYA